MRWTRRRAMLVLVLTNLLWAGSYVAGKEALAALSPVELNALRFGVAGLLLAPVLWRDWPRLSIGRRDLPGLALLCLLGFVLAKAAAYTGLSLTSASDTALLIASESIFTAVLAWVILHEVAPRAAVDGLLVGALGVYVVVEQGLTLPHLGGGTRALGDLLVVGSLVFEALYTVLGKRGLARYPGLFILSSSVIGSLVVWIPAAAVEVARDGAPHLGGGAWAGALYLTIGGTILPYAGWFAALRHVDAASASVTLFLQPLAGTLLAVLILGDRPSWATLAGGLCIVGGVWLTSRAHGGATVSDAIERAAAVGGA